MLDRHGSPWAKVAFLGVLLGSKSFLDFSSSGLENPLAHLILIGFFALFLFPSEPWRTASGPRITSLFAVAALGFVNRQDSLLFFFPACASVLFEQARARRARVVVPALLGLAPAFAWLAFSLFYYGSAVPNTAYAKLTGPHIGLSEQMEAGVAYFLDSLYVDFATLPLCLLALGLTLWRSSGPAVLAAAGMSLYLVYVLMAGAVGTHMSGRFFSGVVVLAAFLIATQGRGWSAWGPPLFLGVMVLAASPRSPFRVGTSAYAVEQTGRKAHYVIDTRAYVLREGAALLDYHHDVTLPNHAAYHAGVRFRSAPERVHEGGPGRGFALMVGYSGFAAGPTKHIIDTLGLTDPLMARIPIARTAAWRPGHFFRAMPTGYRASIEQRANLIEDPALHAYYQVIFDITRGPLWSQERLRAIWRLNTGRYDHLLRDYAARNRLRW